MTDLTDVQKSTNNDSSRKIKSRSREARPSARIEQTRERRRSINDPQLKLAVLNSIPGYHLCWMNDEDNRIEVALDSGYSFVEKDEIGLSHSSPVPANSDVGSRVRKYVGRGPNNSETYAYLMKIPDEWHKDDLQRIHDRTQSILKSIHKGKSDAARNTSGVENSYIPTGGIDMHDSIVSRQK